MSRDAIAEVLGRLDYGDGPDDVDYRDRLREVDGLLGAGVVVDVDELVISGGQELWHDLRCTLHPLGWRVVLSWNDHELVIAWAPPRTSTEQVDALIAPYVTAEGYGNGTASIVWHPAVPREWEPDGEVITDLHFEPSAEALLTWLATEPAADPRAVGTARSAAEAASTDRVVPPVGAASTGVTS